MGPLDYLHSLLFRLSLVVMWLCCAVFHLALLALFLAAVWIFEISPDMAGEFATALYQRTNGATFLAIAGLLGVSVFLVARLYVRLWRKLYVTLVTPFLFKDIDDEFMRRQRR